MFCLTYRYFGKSWQIQIGNKREITELMDILEGCGEWILTLVKSSNMPQNL